MKGRAKQTTMALGVKRTPKPENEWSYYLLGGWPEYSQYIPIESVPLCRHTHDAIIDLDLAQRLVSRAMVPTFWSRRCLLEAWRGHAAGTECLAYGTIGVAEKVDLWVRT